MIKSRNKVYKKITGQVIEGLQKGRIPWQKPWTGDFAPMNYKSGRAYSGVNLWVLLSSPFDSNMWLTYKQAQELGGNVKRGEKGTKVCYWNILNKEVLDQESGEKKEKKVFFLKTYTVFNAEQTEGIEFNDSSKVAGAVPYKQAEELLSHYLDSPEVLNNAIGEAYYCPKEDKVVLPVTKDFVSTESYYSTLFHELAHSSGHPKRLNREGIANFDKHGSDKYSKEELIAEMSACFLMSLCGLSQEVDENNQSYINGWIQKLENDPKALFQASKEAQKACDYMLGDSDPNKKELKAA